VSSHAPDITGHQLAWSEVETRDYQIWSGERVVIDTSRLRVEERSVHRYRYPQRDWLTTE
jgi:hypothetical protein